MNWYKKSQNVDESKEFTWTSYGDGIENKVISELTTAQLALLKMSKGTENYKDNIIEVLLTKADKPGTYVSHPRWNVFGYVSIIPVTDIPGENEYVFAGGLFGMTQAHESEVSGDVKQAVENAAFKNYDKIKKANTMLLEKTSTSPYDSIDSSGAENEVFKENLALWNFDTLKNIGTGNELIFNRIASAKDNTVVAYIFRECSSEKYYGYVGEHIATDENIIFVIKKIEEALSDKSNKILNWEKTVDQASDEGYLEVWLGSDINKGNEVVGAVRKQGNNNFQVLSEVGGAWLEFTMEHTLKSAKETVEGIYFGKGLYSSAEFNNLKEYVFKNLTTLNTEGSIFEDPSAEKLKTVDIKDFISNMDFDSQDPLESKTPDQYMELFARVFNDSMEDFFDWKESIVTENNTKYWSYVDIHGTEWARIYDSEYHDIYNKSDYICVGGDGKELGDYTQEYDARYVCEKYASDKIIELMFTSFSGVLINSLKTSDDLIKVIRLIQTAPPYSKIKSLNVVSYIMNRAMKDPVAKQYIMENAIELLVETKISPEVEKEISIDDELLDDDEGVFDLSQLD